MPHRPILVALALLAAPAAEAADSWGLENEKALELRGKVVDLLCELAGDCPAGCGQGKRQLGILTAEGRLVPAAKGNVFFAGAVPDLLPMCGREVHADGLLIENPAMTVYFVQYLKPAPDAQFMPADAFLAGWTARHGEAEEWWRADPTVKAVIEKNGVLGIPGLKPE
jgi:hypothetical protein